MSTSRQFRKSPRLVLYGLAFRILGELAMQAGDGAARPAPGRQDTRQAEHASRQQEQRPLHLHPPVQPQPLVRADADAGR
jgi:hypothetical protein